MGLYREDAAGHGNAKARGAFFTPPVIADFLADWAVRDPSATVLDPTCGEAVFLLAAARRLRGLGVEPSELDRQVFGIDLHEPSLAASMELLGNEGLDAKLIAANVFSVSTPDQFGCPLPAVDAVIGNPPFVRYQEHRGETRKLSVSAALRQGVRLSGLASSWAAVLVHACGFLKPEGRLAMVLPAELLTVQYAEPVRRWLRRRFGGVTLVMFEHLQFENALEKVVLVLAHGSGGCESFNLQYIYVTDELAALSFGDGVSVTPSSEGKWTDLMLPLAQRRLYKAVVTDHFVPLQSYGVPTLGGVTGANDFFALSETTRLHYDIPERELTPICPPGSRHLTGTAFGVSQWKRLKEAGERVWLFRPAPSDFSAGAERYIAHGYKLGVPDAYKCQIRDPWWRPPVVPTPDLFFTYMSHRYPRLVTNGAKVAFLNSMHGVRLRDNAPKVASKALPLLVLNSATMLGAEIHGRSYGGGVLKMEPREAAELPIPGFAALEKAWDILRPDRDQLDRQLQAGLWTNVVKHIDSVLLQDVLGLPRATVVDLYEAAASLRGRRISQ
jgi:adenine-specific DNA methylase